MQLLAYRFWCSRAEIACGTSCLHLFKNFGRLSWLLAALASRYEAAVRENSGLNSRRFHLAEEGQRTLPLTRLSTGRESCSIGEGVWHLSLLALAVSEHALKHFKSPLILRIFGEGAQGGVVRNSGRWKACSFHRLQHFERVLPLPCLSESCNFVVEFALDS